MVPSLHRAVLLAMCKFRSFMLVLRNHLCYICTAENDPRDLERTDFITLKSYYSRVFDNMNAIASGESLVGHVRDRLRGRSCTVLPPVSVRGDVCSLWFQHRKAVPVLIYNVYKIHGHLVQTAGAKYNYLRKPLKGGFAGFGTLRCDPTSTITVHFQECPQTVLHPGNQYKTYQRQNFGRRRVLSLGHRNEEQDPREKTAIWVIKQQQQESK